MPSLPIIDRPSPNHEPRREGIALRYIVLHATGTQTAEEAAERYLDPAPNDDVGRIAPHYLIAENGEIMRFVPEDRRAWHAGRAFWNGIEDMNSASIGIELANPLSDACPVPFPDAQIAALIALCQDIQARCAIPAHNIVGHSDISPGRKRDPGPLTDWKKLAAHGVGVFPEIAPEDRRAAAALDRDPPAHHAALCALGYDPRLPLETLQGAFTLHYGPNDETARLCALLRTQGLRSPAT